MQAASRGASTSLGEGTGVHYRFYKLGVTGGIVSASDIEAADDGDATAQARALAGKRDAPFELWRGTVRVHPQDGEPPARR